MKRHFTVLALALATSLSLLAQDPNKPANGQNPPPAPPPGQNGQGGGGGGSVHVLPRGAKEKLNLTADQQKQISDLEADATNKLQAILTPDQLEQLKQMRPQGGGRGQGGQGGGQGGQGGRRPPPQQNNNQ